jgi:hypothetical protein
VILQMEHTRPLSTIASLAKLIQEAGFKNKWLVYASS